MTPADRAPAALPVDASCSAPVPTQVNSSGEARTRWVVVLTAVMMVAELVVGWLTHSLALTADGWHMATHVGALGLSAIAYWYARTRANETRFAFGTGKVYALAGFTSSTILLLVSFEMVASGVSRLIKPETVDFADALPVAVIGLIVNLVSAWLLDAGHDHGHSHGPPTSLLGQVAERAGAHSHDHGAHDHAAHDHRAHDHGAHDHGPHDHGPHDHGPHDRGPHDRGPHDHAAHGQSAHDHAAHGQSAHAAHDHGSHDHGAHDHAAHDHAAHDHAAHGQSAHDHAAHDHGSHDHGAHAQAHPPAASPAEARTGRGAEASSADEKRAQTEALRRAVHEIGHDHNLRAAYLHVVADAMTSLLAIAALLAGRYFDLVWLDAIVAIVAAAVILKWAWGLISDCARQLIDLGPSITLREKVRGALESKVGTQVIDLHLWHVGPTQLVCVASLATSGTTTLDEYKRAVVEVVPVDHLTIEIAPRR